MCPYARRGEEEIGEPDRRGVSRRRETRHELATAAEASMESRRAGICRGVAGAGGVRNYHSDDVRDVLNTIRGHSMRGDASCGRVRVRRRTTAARSRRTRMRGLRKRLQHRLLALRARRAVTKVSMRQVRCLSSVPRYHDRPTRRARALMCDAGLLPWSHGDSPFGLGRLRLHTVLVTRCVPATL